MTAQQRYNVLLSPICRTIDATTIITRTTIDLRNIGFASQDEALNEALCNHADKLLDIRLQLDEVLDKLKFMQKVGASS